MISKALERLSLLAHGIAGLAFSWLSVRRGLVVLCNYNGRGMGDCIAPIVNELLRRKTDAEIVLLVNDLSTPVPDGVRKVRRGWVVEKMTLARAQVRISNTKGTFDFTRKRGSYYIQMWHGDLPFKYIEAECEDRLSPYYVALSRRDSRNTDFIVSGSSLFSQVVRESFWYSPECQLLEYGNPRKDILFSAKDEDVSVFKEQNFGSRDIHVALVAPTFRQNIPNESICFDAKGFHAALERRFGGKWVVVIRLHPNVAGRSDLFEYGGPIVNGTQIENGQMLALASDLLVSDYSSIIEDFIIQKKPVFLYVKDIQDYQSRERKLRDFYFRLPFRRCETGDELMAEVANFDGEKYSHGLNVFLSRDYRIFDDGHASERVADLIERLMA